jgi:hypothetical protein
MGADLCMVFLAAPRELNLSDNREEALDCLNQLEEEYKTAVGDAESESDEEYERIDKWYEGQIHLQGDELTRHSIESEFENVKSAIDCLTGVLHPFGSHGRDVSWTEFGEYKLYYTGGMSWGDTPTDAFDWFIAIDNCVPVSQALGLTWPE